jgi:acyl transferase domain-containing protein
MRDGLDALAAGRPHERVITGVADRGEPAIAFLLTGQGSQYAGMGRSLYEKHPVFRDAMDRCAAALEQHLPTRLISVLYPPAGGSSPIDETLYVQPVLLSFEYALACLWQSWGVKPAALLGHSLGEYTAACISGLLELETALALVTARGRLMASLPPNGAMTAILAPEARVRRAIQAEAGTVAIASINAPENIVISGERDAVGRVANRLALEGVDVRPLNMSYAAHSPLLDPALDAFEGAVAHAVFGRATVPIVSNVTGQMLTESEQRSAHYWRRHAREPVRFADGIRTLVNRGVRCFLEVGPHTTASGMAGRCLAGTDALVVPSLRKGREDLDQLLETVARLYVRGVPFDWQAIAGGRRSRPVHLPTYPFDRARHWPDALDATRELPVAISSTEQHPVLAGRLDLADEPGAAVWTGTLDLARHRFLEDHLVQEVPVVPATLYMELALAAATNGRAGGSVQLRDFEFHRPLLLKTGVPASMQVRLTPGANGTSAVRVHSRVPDGEWNLHLTGTVGVASSTAGDAEPLEQIRRRCERHLTGREFYDLMARRGNQWGPAFQGIVAVWQGEGEALSRIEVPDAIAGEVASYFLHPALADASGQVLAATIPLEAGSGQRGGAFVGGGIDAVNLVRTPRGREFWAHARIRPATAADAGVLVGDVTLMDADGVVLCVSEGCRFWYVDRDARQPADRPVGLYHVDWVPQANNRAAATAAPASVVIFSDDAGVGPALAGTLRAAGSDVRLVRRRDIRSAGDIAVALGPADPREPAHVVLLWALDSDAAAVADRAYARCHELLTVVQVAAQHPAAARLRLWAVTTGAQSIGSSATPDAVQAMLWGLGRTVVTEHQEIWGGLVDLDRAVEPATAAAELAQILSESGDAGEDQIAVRNATRFVPRLRRLDVPRRAAVSCRPDATYLITGGGGGLGLEVADFLVRRGARHLLLLGRSSLPPREQWASLASGDPARERCDRIQALTARGVSVRYAAADVGDAGQLADVIAANHGCPPIRGVVHAAGVMQYQPLASQDAAAMREIFRSKVSGTWNLHSAFPSLDFFVLFSSAACILPSPLVGSYAAANAFLDGLAHVRRASRLPALSVNWGAWTGVGMGARFAREHAENARDTDHAFSPAAGIAALERLMSADVVQATALGVDWQRWAGQYPQLARSPFMKELMAASNAGAVDKAGHLDLVAAVRQSRSAADRTLAVRAYLAESVGSVLGFAPHQLDLELPISSAGFDSMMALELKNRLSRELQLVVPLVRFLDGPSVSQLAVVIAEALEARQEPAASTAGWDEGEI